VGHGREKKGCSHPPGRALAWRERSLREVLSSLKKRVIPTFPWKKKERESLKCTSKNRGAFAGSNEEGMATTSIQGTSKTV